MYTDGQETVNMMSEKVAAPKKKKKRWIGVIFNFLLFAGVIYLTVMFLTRNTYKKYEQDMIDKAKVYIEQNEDSFVQDTYLDIGKLGTILPSNCSNLSGVFFDGGNYIPYLSCSDYESNLETNEKNKEYIKLFGNGIIILMKGDSYQEPGYSCKNKVEIFGNVGTDVGFYKLFYNDSVNDKMVERKVVVVDNSTIKSLVPKITINGSKTKYVLVNTDFDKSDVVAVDEIDGDLSSKIKIDGNLNTSVMGEYDVVYSVVNSRGYRNYATRKVKVVDHIVALDVNLNSSPTVKTNNEVTISVEVDGESFDKVKYPDGSISQEKKSVFKVSENGEYEFIFYDKTGQSISKKIEITNIDPNIPDGVCKTTLYGNRSKTRVSISSTREIDHYEYIIDDESSGIVEVNEYESTMRPSKVSVKITDNYGDQNEIVCTLSEPEPYTDAKGKNCLDGYICYVQFDYGSERYPYCSMSTANSCGTISRNGCSITSATIAIAGFGKKSSSGEIFNPYSVWSELYEINKRTGYCDVACSSWTRIKGAIKNAGLTPAEKSQTLNNDISTQTPLIEHLKKGYPVVVHAGEGAYAAKGHYMALIGIRESDNYVFLSDPANRSGTIKKQYNGKTYYADTYISISDLVSGKVDSYLLVGPSGYAW